VDNLYSESEAAKCKSNLDLRVYTSNLLGASDELVLHGGGNTSVKGDIDGIDVLHVKGSGWNLSDIKAEGFAPVRLDVLLEMAKEESLSDSEMVARQREAMMNAHAPNPSVEAILHALIPYKFVDHTHADAIVTISNSVDGDEHIAKLFENFLIVDYVMPGFELAHKIYELTKDMEWSEIEGIIQSINIELKRLSLEAGFVIQLLDTTKLPEDQMLEEYLTTLELGQSIIIS